MAKLAHECSLYFSFCFCMLEMFCNKQLKNYQSNYFSYDSGKNTEKNNWKFFLNKQKVTYFTYFENALFISALKLDCFLSNMLQSVSCFFFLTYRKTVPVSGILAIWKNNSSKKVSYHKGQKKLICSFTPISVNTLY